MLAIVPSETLIISSGVYPGASTYTIWGDGSGNYYSKTQYGALAYTGTNASEIFEDVWAAMTEGGTIHFVGTIELDTPLTFNMTKQTKNLILEGEGETRSILQYEGSGYALTIGDPIGVGEWGNTKLTEFCLDGVTNASGRHGLRLADTAAPLVTVDRVKIRNFDVGFYLHNVNSAFIQQININNCNDGVRIQSGVLSSTNALYFRDSWVINCTDYGIRVVEGGTTQVFDGGIIEYCKTGIYLEGLSHNVAIRDYYLQHNSVSDVDAEGDVGFPLGNVEITNTYFSSAVDYNLLMTRAAITLHNCRFANTLVACVEVANNADNRITTIDCDFNDITPFDGTPTYGETRIMGSVIENLREGLIVRCAQQVNDTQLIVKSSTTGSYSSTSSANVQFPCIVMYGNVAAGGLCVIATKGVTPVMNATVLVDKDFVVSSTTQYQAGLNNSPADMSYVAGSVVAVGVYGDVYVKVPY